MLVSCLGGLQFGKRLMKQGNDLTSIVHLFFSHRRASMSDDLWHIHVRALFGTGEGGERARAPEQ